MIPQIKQLLSLSLVAMLVACSTEPQISNPPPPPPPKTQAPEPPPMESTKQAEQSAPSTGESSPADAEQAQSPASATTDSATPAEDLPPKSNEEADVEITDIPVDENGNPIVSVESSDQPQENAGKSGTQDTRGGAMPNASSSINQDGAPVTNIGASTTAEQAAQLEQNLDAKFAEFDELMRRAREDAAREKLESGGGSPAGTAPAAQGSRRTPTERNGAGGQADTSSGLGHTPDLVGSNRSGTVQRPANQVPADIPQARDDDIVARQLREAATRETDPQLREKLWDEYRKYTRGTN